MTTHGPFFACSGVFGRLLTAAAALILINPLPAQAEKKESATIVVTATRTENKLTDLPAFVSEVSRDAIEERQASAISEITEGLSGVDFGGGPRSAGEIPTIRGQYGNHIILMVDGARRNDRSGVGILSPLVIDPDMLDRVEVVRGPISSLYGSGGLGGVMALHTLSATDLLKEGQRFGGEVRGGTESADDSRHLHFRLFGRSGAFDGLVAATHRTWDDLAQGGGGTLKPNDGDSDSLLAKIGIQPSEQLRFELSHHYAEEQSLRPNNPQGNNDFPMVQDNSTRLNEDRFKLERFAPNGERSVAGTLYHTVTERSADANPDASLPATRSETDTLGGDLQHTLHLGKHRITYGGDLYRDKQTARSDSAPNGVQPDGEQTAYGLFIQDEMDLDDAWKLIPSLRGDRYTTHKRDDTQPDTDDSHLSPKLALHWQTTPSLGIYTSYGEAFRAPSLNEMYQSLSGNNYFANFEPNTDLEPETSRSLELGGRYAREGLFSTDDHASLAIAIYREWVDDLIESAVVGSYVHPFIGPRPILQYQNVSNAKRWGLELEGDYVQGPWDWHLAYTRIRAKDEDSGEHLFSPPDQLNLQARYWLTDYDISLLWNTTATAAQDYDSNIERRRPGWARHDLFLSWTPEGSLRIDIGVENLTDKRYASYQSANAYALTYEKGRSLKATVSWRF